MLKSMATGVIIGAAVGMLVLPQLDRKTQRVIKKTGKRVVHLAEDAYGNIVEYVK